MNKIDEDVARAEDDDAAPAAAAAIKTPPVNVDLRHLRYFVAVAEELHFGRAAARLYLAQPALSHSIKALEKELDVSLLNRTTRSVSLTPAGQELLSRARVLLGSVADAFTEVRSVGGRDPSPLTLFVSPDVERIVGPIIDAVAALEGARIETAVRRDAEAVQAVRAGRCDAAFCWTPGFVGDELTKSVVSRQELLAALPSGHALASMPAVPARALAGHPAVLFPRADAPGLWDAIGDGVYAFGGLPHLSSSDRYRTQEEMVRCARERGHVTVVSRAFVDSHRPAGTVFRPLVPAVIVTVELVTRVDAPLRVQRFGSMAARSHPRRASDAHQAMA